MVKSIVIAAPVLTRSGYGAHSREIVRSILKIGKYDVKIIPTRWGTTPQTALNPNDPKDAEIFNRLIGGNIKEQPDLFIQITIPNEFQAVGKYNIGITAGIETTLCSADWIEGINRMSLTLATSKHSHDTFLKSIYDATIKETGERKMISVQKPVRVLFEGVETDVYKVKKYGNDSELTKHLTDTIKEDFCFLFVGHWLTGNIGSDRKDVGTLIRLFFEAFYKKAPQNRPALILKTSSAGFSITERYEIDRKINEIKNMVYRTGYSGELPSIYVVYGDLTDSQMNELYNHDKVKAMVSFTHGEGFGKPLLEFSMVGKPIIASKWSGQLDFLNPEYTTLLGGQVREVSQDAVNEWIIKESKWFYVNHNNAIARYRDLYDNYEKYLDLAKKQKNYCANNFTFEKMTEQLEMFIDNIDKISQEKNTAPIPDVITIPKGDGEKVKFTLPKLKPVN